MTSHEQEQLMHMISNDPFIQKYILHHTWISGENATVYPIQGWLDSIDVQINTDKNVFSKCIDRIVKNSNGALIKGYFDKSNGSCPSRIVFKLKDNIDLNP